MLKLLTMWHASAENIMTRLIILSALHHQLDLIAKNPYVKFLFFIKCEHFGKNFRWTAFSRHIVSSGANARHLAGYEWTNCPSYNAVFLKLLQNVSWWINCLSKVIATRGQCRFRLWLKWILPRCRVDRIDSGSLKGNPVKLWQPF